MSKPMTFIKYFILALIGVIAIWQIIDGSSAFGVGLLAGIVFSAVALGIKSRQLNHMVEKGIEPYDERVWMIAGKASYASMKIFAIIIALIVLFGSIWGPQTLVNPYNLLGICLACLMLLYVGFYYCYSRIM